MSRTLSQCFKALGIFDGDEISTLNNLQEEFTYVKKIYHAKILTVHPDKGGDVASFREVRTSWDAIKQVYENHKITTFVTCFKGTRTKKTTTKKKTTKKKKGKDDEEEIVEEEETTTSQEEFSFSWDDIQREFSSHDQPSYDFYAAAEQEEVPTYMVEIARSSRGTCKAKGNAKRCPEDDIIMQGELRVGVLNKESGSYWNWTHIPCWRVASKIWKGLEHLGTHETIADTNRDHVANALSSMNEILLTGFDELTDANKKAIVDHIMDSSNWAAYRAPKAKPIDLIKDENNNAKSSSSTNSGINGSASSSDIVKAAGTALVQAKQRYIPPTPGVNGAEVNALAGKTIVMTGVFPEVGGGTGLSLGKDKMKAILTSFGARVTSAISGQTDLLLTGTEPGASKVSQARTKHIPLITSHDLKLGLESGKVYDQWVEDTPKLIIDSFSKGFSMNKHRPGNAITMGKEQEAIAKGLKAAPAVIKGSKKPRRRSPGNKLENEEEDLNEADGSSDEDNYGGDDDDYKPKSKKRKRKASKTSHYKEEEEDDVFVSDGDQEDIPEGVDVFGITCDSCEVDCTTESFHIARDDTDYCPSCYENTGATDGDLQRYGISIEPCQETALVIKPEKKPRKSAKKSSKVSNNKSTKKKSK